MTPLVRTGITLGLLWGLGVALVWWGLPMHRRQSLEARVLPYLRDAPRPSGLLVSPHGARSIVGPLLAPLVTVLSRAVDRVLGGSDTVLRRQQRAGDDANLERFRAQQVLAGAAGAVLGGALGTLLAAWRGGSAVVVVGLVGVGGGLGLVGWDSWLTRRAERREARMLVEFPTIAELLALAVAAGEGTVGALERVVRLSRGELCDELRRTLADARAGANLPTALQGLADRTGLPSLTRFVDGIVIAVQRGTPLAEVLRAQAQDVREDSKRLLLESAGRQEIAMMVPVVFLILPVTVVFALFPGLAFLDFRL
jgi:tight adherence protein C